jgi:hypothetical protein
MEGTVQRRIFFRVLLGVAAALPLSQAWAQESDQQRCDRLAREERDAAERLESKDLAPDERARLEKMRAGLHDERERTCPH